MAGGKGPAPTNRLTLLAKYRLDKLGLDPLDMLLDAINFNKESAIAGEGAEYAAAWLRGCCELMKYRYPVLSAVAIQDVTEKSDRQPMTSQQAIEVLKRDPFLQDNKTPLADIQQALLPKGAEND